MLEVMSFTTAVNRGLLKHYKATDPQSECWIIYNHTTKRDVYFGNRKGAKLALKTLQRN